MLMAIHAVACLPTQGHVLPACLPACLPRGATDDTRAGSADGFTDVGGDAGADSAAASRSVGRPASAYHRSGSLGTGLSVASIASRN